MSAGVAVSHAGLSFPHPHGCWWSPQSGATTSGKTLPDAGLVFYCKGSVKDTSGCAETAVPAVTEP